VGKGSLKVLFAGLLVLGACVNERRYFRQISEENQPIPLSIDRVYQGPGEQTERLFRVPNAIEMLTPEQYEEKLRNEPEDLKDLRIQQQLERYFEEHLPKPKYDSRNVA
jgi:hypothetical protein